MVLRSKAGGQLARGAGRYRAATAAAAEPGSLSAAEQPDVRELIEVDHRDGRGLHAAHRQARHRAVVLVGQRAEVGVDPGDQIIDHELSVSAAPGTADTKPGSAAAAGACAGAPAPGAAGRCRAPGPPAATHGAGFHDHDHGFDLARGKQVVEDHIGPAHLDPDPLVFAAAVLQIQHRVAGLALL